MKTKQKDKSVRVDQQTYEIISKIARKTKRKIKAVVYLAVSDYWEKI